MLEIPVVSSEVMLRAGNFGTDIHSNMEVEVEADRPCHGGISVTCQTSASTFAISCCALEPRTAKCGSHVGSSNELLQKRRRRGISSLQDVVSRPEGGI